MTSRLMDIVVYVAERMRACESTPQDLDRELSVRGFERGEIDTALSWYAAHGVPSLGAGRPGATRVLNDFERMSISADCYGYLLRLLDLGIIDIEAFDRILVRATPVGPEKIHLGDVKAIASTVVFEPVDDRVDDELPEDFVGDSPPA